MNKNYIAPQTEVMQLGTTLMQDTISLMHHSGGSNSGTNGFTEDQII